MEKIFELASTEADEETGPWTLSEGDEEKNITVDEAKDMVSDFYDQLVIADLTSFAE